jgi:tetratricopeptide (TPR) repeat protein
MRLCCPVLLLVACTCGVATAQSVNRVEARRHFEDGSKLYHLGEFNAAAEEYKAAYKANPDPAFLYNIAQAYRLGGDYQQAVFFYRSFLGAVPDAPNRAEVEDRIRKLEAQIATQRNEHPPAPPTPPSGTQGATTPSTGANNLTVTTTAKRETPVYKKWWLWTIVGGVAVAAVVGVSVGLATHPTITGAPASHFGTVSF